jgi:hypothetical protein
MPLRLRKYIQNKIPKQTEITKNEEKKTIEYFDFRIITHPSFCLDIIYFANLFVNPPHGPRLIREQLTDLVATGLTRFSRVHIVLSLPDDFDYPSLQDNLTFLFQRQYRTLEFHIGHDNCHEYPGIQQVHSLAREDRNRNHYILYFHSKGITRFHGRREHVEMALHKTVIDQWKNVLQIFDTHPNIDKIGSTASTGGWIWWNYWWARASYLTQVEKPVKTERRHYYEDWLCRVFVKPEEHTRETNADREENCFEVDLYHHDPSNCWSLSLKEQPIGEGCEPLDALRLLLQGLG